MKEKVFLLPKLLTAIAALLLVGACAAAMKTYEGPVLPADRTAIIESGPYTTIERCDGVRVTSAYLAVAVLPGRHTIDVAFRGQSIGIKFLYASETAPLTFTAEAGHRYVAYATPVPETEWLGGYVVSEYRWVAYVLDKETGKKMANSERLPVRMWPIPGGNYNFP
jgi:hypothetical protein